MQSVASLLDDDDAFLIILDKCYCFDHFIPVQRLRCHWRSERCFATDEEFEAADLTWEIDGSPDFEIVGSNQRVGCFLANSVCGFLGWEKPNSRKRMTELAQLIQGRVLKND